MIYPENFEEKTGFDRIRQMLSDNCLSSLGRKEVEDIRFLTKQADIEKLQNQTEEFRQILLLGELFPASNYYDPEKIFSHLRPEETFIEPEDMLELKRSLETIRKIISFLRQKNKEEDSLKYPWLFALTEGLELDPGIIKRIEAIIDEKAVVKSNASPRLSKIRQSKQELEVKANRKISQVMNQGKSQCWIDQDIELALRNGRQVIPVSASSKRRIRGFIHDQSATGQTVFLEPEEVFEINNEIRELDLEERREIIRILKDFGDYLRPAIPGLKDCYQMLARIDLTRSKAKIAMEMEAMKPKLQNEPKLHWIKALHPLLYLSHKAQNKHVEPLNITLNREQRILVISGPNAGGKSVCLKTCGLLQYMLQCGLLLPMLDYSEAGIFDRIFIDIGDEQSLENDLSTYSSHLLNMKFFVEKSNEKTLFLIDEFGAGTEPRIGGSIAEAILEQLNSKKAQGVITTHYANLKLMAGKHQGIINGSMLFDTKNMRPLFRLKTGNPGSSFAFEIAKTIGLSEKILNRAAEHAGSQELDFDRQLQDLDLKKAVLEEKEKQLRSADRFLAEMIEKYEKLSGELESRKSNILAEARKEAKDILSGTNKIIEKTIREIKEARAEKEKTREARKALEDYSQQHEQALKKEKKPPKKKAGKKGKQEPTLDLTPIKPGDSVRVKGQQAFGEVLEISGTKAVVSFGSIKFKTSLASLEKIKKSSLRGHPSQPGRTRSQFNINEKAAAFNPEIDLRGKRADEAISQLRKFVDDAILLGVKQLNILHGKGDGILRQTVRDYLQSVPEVRRFRDEHPDRGGAGTTIAELK